MKHTIWTNNLDYKDWKDDLESQYPDAEGYNEDERTRLMYEINDDYLEDEKINLNKELGHNIIVLGDLGLWFGRRTGYKKLGTNLNSIFSGTCGDYITWYVEGEDVKCDDTHHDGTNHYVYRVLKSDIDQYEFDEYAYEHSIEEAINKFTKPLGHYVAEIYGFKLEENHD